MITQRINNRSEWIDVVDGLIRSKEPRTLLRLGDRELDYLIKSQDSPVNFTFRSQSEGDFATVEQAAGCLGLLAEHRDRLQLAYEEADLVDLFAHPHQTINSERLPNWRRETKYSQWQIDLPECAGVVLDWTIHRMGQYLKKHRILVCGAEASLQKCLLDNIEYREIFFDIWTKPENVLFIQPPNDGRSLGRDLETLKARLEKDIDSWNPSAVFLCLGGAAKVLANEIRASRMLTVVDWGSTLRALTYSGSGGHSLWRAAHHPFVRRVPLRVYMEALRRACPDRAQSFYLTKAHAQMALDVHRQKEGVSVPSDIFSSDSFDRSASAIRRFRESRSYYKRNLLPFASDTESTRLVKEFKRWRRVHGLGLDGQIYQSLKKLISGRHR